MKEEELSIDIRLIDTSLQSTNSDPVVVDSSTDSIFMKNTSTMFPRSRRFVGSKSDLSCFNDSITSNVKNLAKQFSSST